MRLLTLMATCILVASIAEAGDWSSDVVSGEREPRRLCSWYAVALYTNTVETGQLTNGVENAGARYCAVKGISFFIGKKTAVVGEGETLRMPVNDMKYAGDSGIASQDDKDRGALVFHKIEKVYLLNVVTGNSDDAILGEWVFEYEDGSSAKEDIVVGENIGTINGTAEWAEKAGDSLFLAEVVNPYMEKKVKGLNIRIAGSGKYNLVAVTCRLGRDKVHD